MLSVKKNEFNKYLIYFLKIILFKFYWIINFKLILDVYLYKRLIEFFNNFFLKKFKCFWSFMMIINLYINDIN